MGKKLDEIRALGQPEIARRYVETDAKLQGIAKAARLKTAREKLSTVGTSAIEAMVYVKTVRAGTGKTQGEFAAAYGFNQRSLERWERGASRPGKSVMDKLRKIEADE